MQKTVAKFRSMKRWLIVILISLLVLFFAVSYFIIPGNIHFTRAITVNINQTAVYRTLSEKNNWQKWWPAEKSQSLALNGFNFKIDKIGFNVLSILVEKGRRPDSTFLHILPVTNDSATVIWDVKLHTGGNPFRNISQYIKARKMISNCELILANMKDYLNKNENIYGLKIWKDKIHIEYMVSVKNSYNRRPSDQEIYEIINSIRKYIAQVGGIEQDRPFCNITAVDSTNVELVVGVPVTAPLPESGNFRSIKMLKNGNILYGEVKGGHASVDIALKQIDLFAKDHECLNIAIPFQIFLTDRLAEKDTTRWVTRIGYPIL